MELGSNHSFANNAAVKLLTSGSLPAPLNTTTTYYVRDVVAGSSGSFKLATAIGGTANIKGQDACRRFLRQRVCTSSMNYPKFNWAFIVCYSARSSARRLLTRTDALGVTTMTHTDDGRVDLESTVFGTAFPQLGGGQNLVVNPSYDAQGRCSALDYAWGTVAGHQVVYGYGSGKLTSLTGGGRSAVFSAFASNGSPATTEYRVGATKKMTRTHSPDGNGRASYVGYTGHNGATNTILQSFTYTYDRYQVTKTTRENNQQWRYGYNAVNEHLKLTHLRASRIDPPWVVFVRVG